MQLFNVKKSTHIELWSDQRKKEALTVHGAREKYPNKKSSAYYLHFRSIKAFFPHLAQDTVTTRGSGPRSLRK